MTEISGLATELVLTFIDCPQHIIVVIYKIVHRRSQRKLLNQMLTQRTCSQFT